MTVRTRFAPSPTGFLHIGGVRTALFNWLLARHFGGRFLLRIDDTDQERQVEDAVKRILDGFRWIGIDWDEGPDVGGPNGPYYQSQRTAKYQAAVQQLIESGHVYRDYSTEPERAAEKAAAERAKRAYRFRRLAVSPEQLARFESEGRPYALRFQVPLGRTLVVHDLIKGDVTFSTDEIGDFVVVRPTVRRFTILPPLSMTSRWGSPTLSGPRNISPTRFPSFCSLKPWALRCRLLPTFPTWLNLGPKRRCRSARSSSMRTQGVLVYLHQYIERGYLPDALLNYLARLGWSYDATQEIFTLAELIEKFTLERVTSSGQPRPGQALLDRRRVDEGTSPRSENHWRAALPQERRTGHRTRDGCRSGQGRGGDPGTGRPAQGLFRYPQARPVLLHQGARPRPRRREETTPQGDRADDARPSSMRSWPRSSLTTWRLSRK